MAYSPYYPQPQNPNHNSYPDPGRSYYSNNSSSLLQPPALDPNPTLYFNPNLVAASSRRESQAHRLGIGLSYSYPQADSVAPKHYARGPQLAVNPFGTGVPIPHTLSEKFFTETNSIIQTNQTTGLRESNRLWKKSAKKLKVVQSVWCDVCKIECNSKTVLHLHKLGSKHKRNLQSLGLVKSRVVSGVVNSTVVSGVVNSTVVSSVVNSSLDSTCCEVCKVDCTSKVVLDGHNLGKKHKKNLEKLTTANSSVPQAWCEVCKTDCNSKIVLDQHKLGKKHKRNLEKLASDIGPASLPSASAVVDTFAIRRGENPGEATAEGVERSKKKEVGGDDLETKKRKVLERGAAAEDVRVCDICNVVCNSETVFKIHLAGQKHVAMLKKQESTISTDAAT